MFDLTEESEELPDNLDQILLKSYERKSLNCCAIKPDSEVEELRTEVGLVKGHAYSITKVKKNIRRINKEIEGYSVQVVRIDLEDEGEVVLVRIRNPWGNEFEWTGAWADGSPEWDSMSQDEKECLGINFECDGEWWMTQDDFLKNFDQLELCHLPPERMTDKEEAARWFVNQWTGEWIEGQTAGGCR